MSVCESKIRYAWKSTQTMNWILCTENIEELKFIALTKLLHSLSQMLFIRDKWRWNECICMVLFISRNEICGNVNVAMIILILKAVKKQSPYPHWHWARAYRKESSPFSICGMLIEIVHGVYCWLVGFGFKIQSLSKAVIVVIMYSDRCDRKT